jgi:uncharacterized protein (TIGR00369 family)
MLTMTREGPFWEAVEGRAPLPPAAVTLGWELVAINPEEGTIEVAFTAADAFLNPAGVVQGGFLAAMLDETMGPALVCGLEPGDFAPTTDLHVQFLRPARPGRLVGRGGWCDAAGTSPSSPGSSLTRRAPLWRWLPPRCRSEPACSGAQLRGTEPSAGAHRSL